MAKSHRRAVKHRSAQSRDFASQAVCESLASDVCHRPLCPKHQPASYAAFGARHLYIPSEPLDLDLR